MTASGISLADAYVWLALAVEAHVHHPAAKSWFDSQPTNSSAFCRITQLALLRHLTNPKILGAANVQTQEQAWRVYEALVADPRVIYLDEPQGLTTPFKSLSSHATPSHSQWTDAFLVAFANCLGIKVVTFDRGFQRFNTLNVRLLTLGDSLSKCYSSVTQPSVADLMNQCGWTRVRHAHGVASKWFRVPHLHRRSRPGALPHPQGRNGNHHRNSPRIDPSEQGDVEGRRSPRRDLGGRSSGIPVGSVERHP